MMRATVDSMIRFRGQDCPPKALERLRKDLAFINPEYVTRNRLSLYLGDTPQLIECLAEDKTGIVEIPRGAAGLLKQRLRECSANVTFEDGRVEHPPVAFGGAPELRPYQEQAVQAMQRGTQGVVVMPCGGGKTIAGLGAVARIKQPTLVIVHTRDLLEQWTATIQRDLQVAPGVIAEGEINPAVITVATVQTLVRLEPGRFDEITRGFGCVILDEAHHCPASTFQSVVSRFPAKHRFGLTATPERADGLTPLIGVTFGPCLFEISYAELVAGGWLNAPVVREVRTAFSFDWQGPEDLHRLMDALADDADRNRLIVDLTVAEARAGHTVLVLSERVEHCRLLAENIRTQCVCAEALVGTLPKDKRRAVLDDFRDGRLPVVVATTLADEGLDVPRLDRVILAWPGRAKGRATQRLGRLMRPCPGKGQAVLIDLVDAGVPVLKRRHAERRKVYASLGLGGAP